MRKLRLVALCVACVVAGGLCSGAEYRVEERRLGPAPVYPPRLLGRLTLSRDGLHIAYVGSRRAGRVLLDGVPEPPFREIGTQPLLFSPDGRRLAYVARDADGWHMVVGSAPGPAYDRIGTQGFVGGVFTWWPGSMVFSPDSSRLAYIGGQSDPYKSVVVVDGRELPWSDGAGHIVFSADGSRLACVTCEATEGGLVSRVVVDGAAGPQYDGIDGGSITLSQDGRHVAYLARKGDKWLVVADGKDGHEYDEILSCPPMVTCPLTIDRAGKPVAYVVRKASKWVAVVHGKEQAEYDYIRELAIGPEAKRVAYVADTGRRSLVVDNGREEPKYRWAAGLVLSQDGKRLAYKASKRRRGSSLVVLDGVEGPVYDGLGWNPLLFSPDGERLVYRALRGEKSFVVVDGKESPEYDLVSKITLSPDGRRVAYIASEGEDGDRVVVDNGPWARYRDVWGSIRFSADSDHVAYCASREEDRYLVVTNGFEGPEYDRILFNSVAFDQRDRAVYLAVRNDVLYRVKHIPVE